MRKFAAVLCRNVTKKNSGKDLPRAIAKLPKILLLFAKSVCVCVCAAFRLLFENIDRGIIQLLSRNFSSPAAQKHAAVDIPKRDLLDFWRTIFRDFQHCERL